jgi:calpain
MDKENFLNIAKSVNLTGTSDLDNNFRNTPKNKTSELQGRTVKNSIVPNIQVTVTETPNRRGGFEDEMTSEDGGSFISGPINLADRTNEKITQYSEEIRRIHQDFNGKGIKFEDKKFPAINTSIFKSADRLEEQLKALKSWTWMRPEEIFKKDVAFEILNINELSEIKPGPLSNNNFCNVFSVALLTKLLENVVVDFDNLRMGYASFQFFKNGEWVYVIVDTALPYLKDSKKFLFTNSTGLFSLLVGLLEKAYAKLNGCYEYIELLSLKNMMTEFGCIHTEKIKLEQDYKDQVALKRFFGQMGALFNRKEKLAVFCVKKKQGINVNSKLFEMGNSLGIKENAVHLIQSIEDFSAKELKFVRLKNIWGSEFNWSGPFANNSDEWEKHKDIRDALFGHKLSLGELNTCFYMKLENFVKEFSYIYAVRYVSNDLQVYSLFGSWHGNTMAGVPSDLEVKYPPSMRKTEPFTRVDSDDCWFNNPQYRIKVNQPTRLIIDLSQIDTTSTGQENDNKQVGFYLFKAQNTRNRIWEMPAADQLISVIQSKTRSTLINQETAHLNVKQDKNPLRGSSRETLPVQGNYMTDGKSVAKTRSGFQTLYSKSAIHQFYLEPAPNQLSSCYNLLLFLNHDKSNRKSNEPFPYNLKIFSNKKVEIEMLPQNQEKAIDDAWDAESAGGPYYLSNKGKSENPTWCLNPQYLLTFDAPTHLKIILHKAPKSQKKLKDVKLGLSLSFLKTGFELEETTPINYGTTKKFISAKEELLSKLITKTKEQLTVTKVKNPYRKVKVLKGENYLESTFASTETACLYLKVLPIESPLLIVPCLDRPGLQGEFRLTIFSNTEIGVRPLDRTKNPVAIGDWTQYNSGGSHIYSEQMYSNPEKRTWHTNTAYLASFLTPVTPEEKVKVKLFLNFAECNWQSKVIKKIQQMDEGKMRSKKSLVNVDCMVCLYILKVGSKLSTEMIVHQSPFSPTSSLEFEFDFSQEQFGNQTSFLVMPTTFNVS